MICRIRSHALLDDFSSKQSQNVTGLAWYNFHIQKQILIIFGRTVNEKVGNQQVLKFSTSSNYSASALPGEKLKCKTCTFSLTRCIAVVHARLHPVACLIYSVSLLKTHVNDAVWLPADRSCCWWIKVKLWIVTAGLWLMKKKDWSFVCTSALLCWKTKLHWRTK